MREFTDRVAVVTGAASGLGAALARAFAAEGMRVALADIDHAGVERTTKTLVENGAQARAFRVDVGERESIDQLAHSVNREMGGCDLLAANVGVQQFGRLDELTPGDWEWVFGVNVLGTVHTVRAFLPQMRRGDRNRHIVFTVSTSGLYAVPRIGVYTASKYAVMGYAETLRLELAGEGIGVTMLLPGPMATTHVQSSAAAKPSHLATPAFRPEDLEAVGAEMAGDRMVEPAYAVRNLMAGIQANEPYVISHQVHRERVEQRLADIWRAFDRARD